MDEEEMLIKTKRKLLWIALIGTMPFLVFTMIWGLFLLNCFNPMQLAFISDFEIENKTQQPIWVTPVGTFNSGIKAVLPQSMAAFPAIPAWHSRDLPIAPGARRRVYYDWDDINFSEIVVRDAVGTVAVQLVDAHPPTKDYYANKMDLYEISDIGTLPTPTPAVTKAVSPPPHQTLFWTLAVCGLLAPFPLIWIRRQFRRLPKMHASPIS
ncbi:hypothetical protein [Symmachiella dynata]|nr:hypothetical protein [Symmachiella dynata]